MGRFFQAERSVTPTTPRLPRLFSQQTGGIRLFLTVPLSLLSMARSHDKVAWPRDKLGGTRRFRAETLSLPSSPRRRPPFGGALPGFFRTVCRRRGESQKSPELLAGAPGFEPGITGPKPVALPLGHAPIRCDDVPATPAPVR